MTKPGKVIVIIVQMIVKPLIGLRQERVLEKEMCRQSVVDQARVGSTGELRIDWKLRCKFGFALTLLDDGCEGSFGLCTAWRFSVARDVGRSSDRDVFIVIVEVIVFLRRRDFCDFSIARFG